MIQPTNLWIGYSLLTAAGLLFLWGLRINDKHIWERWWRPAAAEPIFDEQEEYERRAALRRVEERLKTDSLQAQGEAAWSLWEWFKAERARQIAERRDAAGDNK